MKLGQSLAGALAIVVGLIDWTLAQDISQLPKCGLDCIVGSAGNSTCDILDTTCSCNDEALTAATSQCVMQTCNTLDALAIAKFQAETCQVPRRSRTADLYLALIVEIPAWLCPWLRMYSRWTTVNHFAVDDWLMFACGIVFTIFVVIGQYTGQLAFGIDTWYADPDNVTYALKLFYVCQPFYLTCLALTKVSILYFYLRIFPQRTFKNITYGFMVFVTVTTIVMIFLTIFQCRPVRYAYDGWWSPDAEYSCLNINILTYAAASICVVQDFLILVLPLPLLAKLNVSLRRKVGIMFMFSLGVFVLVTSSVRFRYIVLLRATVNPMWDYTDIIIWSGLEVGVSIIVACLPAIRVLLHNILPGLLSSIGSKGGGRANGGYVEEVSGGRSAGTSVATRSKSRSVGLFGSKGRDPETESQIELDIHLGDKVHGNVRTEIYGSQQDSSTGSDDGIRVNTVTTTRVDGRS